MNEVIQTYGIWIAVMAIVSIGSIVYTITYYKKNKKDIAAFLERCPNAAKIYMTQKGAITSEVLQIISVNGDIPLNFNEGTKAGVYVEPSESIELELQYTYTRPGVMYKSVSESTGLVKREVEVEANKSYKVGYDRKEQDFTFEEI